MMACAIVSDPASAPNPYLPPVAQFIPGDITLPGGGSVNFTDQSQNMPTSWTWQINGATFSIGQNPLYYFTNLGRFSIVLTATNSYGSDSKEHTVTVTP